VTRKLSNCLCAFRAFQGLGVASRFDDGNLIEVKFGTATFLKFNVGTIMQVHLEILSNFKSSWIGRRANKWPYKTT
jgi:hypothetical protein